MLPGTCTRPEIRVKLFCEDPQAVCDAQRHRANIPTTKIMAATGAFESNRIQHKQHQNMSCG